MDDVNDDVLVAVAKPSRGREMVATSVPIDVFDSIRQASVGEQLKDKELKPEKSKSNVETYYEGYIDGKKYLVPDSNLEAMKDMINLHMRQRKSTHYRHETSTDVEDDMTIERIDKILSKVKDLRLSNSTVLSLATQKSKNPSEFSTKTSSNITSRSNDQKSNKISHESSKNESLLTTQSPSLSKEDDRLSFKEVQQSSLSQEIRSISSSKHEKGEQQSQFEDDEDTSDDCHLRLILSGHFRDNERPIYIIQEFDTKSNIFNRQNADFTTNQENGKVHIFISGKLFKENVLEEIEGTPAFLNLKPNKVMIDPKTSKVFRSYFESTYNRKAIDITIKGEFLRNESSMDITPFLSVSFQHNDINKTLNDEGNQNQDEEKRPSILIKDRKSISSNSSMKRVSFKDSLDDEVQVIYKNENKRKSNDVDKRNNTEKESIVCDTNNKRPKNNNKTVLAQRNATEQILYYITENSWLKNIFSRGRR